MQLVFALASKNKQQFLQVENASPPFLSITSRIWGELESEYDSRPGSPAL